MPKSIVTFIAGTLLLLSISRGESFSQRGDEQSLKIMFYNVENFFDIYDDPVTDDDEFLPGGDRRWNKKKYRTKINSLFKVISAAGEWSPPAIIAFCEVENRRVLDDLVKGTNLAKFNYGIIHQDSPDPRGIDVCMIYREKVIDILSWRYLIPVIAEGQAFRSRSILYVSCLAGNDSLHLFINHWPSRRGGVLAGESLRESIVMMLREKLDSLASAPGRCKKIILMGDFNATPEDNVIRMLSAPYESGLSIVNLSEEQSSVKGTYRYRGIWEMIDQVMVSDFLLNCREGIYTTHDMFRSFEPDFLLKKDPVYPGMSPLSTYSGFRYQGGFSDHLPVLLELKFRQKDPQESIQALFPFSASVPWLPHDCWE